MGKEMVDADAGVDSPAGSGAPAGGDKALADATSMASTMGAFDDNAPEPDAAGGDEPAGGEGEPEGEGAPATDSDVAEFDSEQAFLESAGIKGHESLKAFYEAQQGQFNAIKETLAQIGFDSKASTLAELHAEMQQAVMERARYDEEGAPGAPAAAAAAPPGAMDDFFKKYGENIQEDARPFYDDFSGATSNRVGSALLNPKSAKDDPSPLGKAGRHLAAAHRTANTSMQFMMYQAAKAEAGDDPVPSFAQTQALLHRGGDLWPNAMAMMERFGNHEATLGAMKSVFNSWRSSQVPGGVTRAQAAKTDAEAKKVRMHRAGIKPTGRTREATKTFDKMTPDEREQAAASMPA